MDMHVLSAHACPHAVANRRASKKSVLSVLVLLALEGKPGRLETVQPSRRCGRASAHVHEDEQMSMVARCEVRSLLKDRFQVADKLAPARHAWQKKHSQPSQDILRLRQRPVVVDQQYRTTSDQQYVLTDKVEAAGVGRVPRLAGAAERDSRVSSAFG